MNYYSELQTPLEDNSKEKAVEAFIDWRHQYEQNFS